jgi:uncharacterized protein YfiM (DUF2279 family)
VTPGALLLALALAGASASPQPPCEAFAHAAPVHSPQTSGAPTTPARPSRRPADRWVAEDKWKHLVTSFFATTVAASAARAAGLSPELSLRAGVAAGAGAGVAKEVYDLGRGGRLDASLRDLVWDAAGLAAGAALVRQTY